MFTQYEWVCLSHIWQLVIRNRAVWNESWRTHEWVMSHIWMSYATHINESCRTYESVMLHIWMSHVSHIKLVAHKGASRNKSHLTFEWGICTYECIMSHTGMSHVTHECNVTHMNAYEWVTPHINSWWYTIELLETLYRLARNEEACKIALAVQILKRQLANECTI